RCCLGFDKEHMPEGADPGDCVLSYLTGKQDGIPKTPEWAEPITGIPAETIRSLARRLVEAKPAAILPGYGPQRHSYGEQGVRGGILLACMTGNVGVRGGSAAGVGYCRRHMEPVLNQADNPVKASIPLYRWTDALDHGHEMTAIDGVKGLPEGAELGTDIKMLFSLAGNALVNQHGDINRTTELLRDESKCEFIVVSDLFMTSSAMYADIVLPGVSFFETENIVAPWLYGDFLGYCNKAVDPVGESRFEYEWLTEIAERLGLRKKFTKGRSHEDWLRYIYKDLRKKEPELPSFEEFREAGIYRYQNNPEIIAFEDNYRDPKAHPFPTESGKIELYSPEVARTQYAEYFPVIPRYVPAIEGYDDPLAERYPLQLISWHTKRRCHSIHDNNLELHRVDPQRLWMNAKDAEARGLEDGDTVIVYNDRGRTQVPLYITDRICPGVTALSQGAWYQPDADGTDLAGSINVLTSLHPTPYARGNAQHTNLVEVRKA
ncbi:MAG: molybdopterin-dependent oxidoreductase, partial [Mogibacterium sp.]|nr:molybdopterin-dependent oxidoreductase [Mogibacterium sp.]